MSLIDHLKPYIDEQSKTGRPVRVESMRRHLSDIGVPYSTRNNRALVCTLNDHTANASKTGRPSKPIYFLRVMGDSWISKDNLSAYEKYIGGPIKIKEYS
jgi:hypothetical protein